MWSIIVTLTTCTCAALITFHWNETVTANEQGEWERKRFPIDVEICIAKRAQSFSPCGQRGATSSYCAIEAIILIALAQCWDGLAVVFHSLKRDARVVTTWHPFRVLFSTRRATHSVEKLFLHRRNVRLLLSMRRLCSGTNELILGFHNRSCLLFRANKRKIFLDAKLKCLKMEMENLVLWVLLPWKRLRKDRKLRGSQESSFENRFLGISRI